MKHTCLKDYKSDMNSLFQAFSEHIREHDLLLLAYCRENRTNLEKIKKEKRLIQIKYEKIRINQV